MNFVIIDEISAWARLGGLSGRALLAWVARTAVEEQCYGIHWEVLDWNEKAIELYKALGATFRDQWRPVLLTD